VDVKLVLEIGAGAPEEILNEAADSMKIDSAYNVEKLNLF
jgi:hypothetical protein